MLQRVVYEDLPQAVKMSPVNCSTEQANGAGGSKVTYLTNPACGVAIHICQEVGCETCRENYLCTLLNSLCLVGLQAQHLVTLFLSHQSCFLASIT